MRAPKRLRLYTYFLTMFWRCSKRERERDSFGITDNIKIVNKKTNQIRERERERERERSENI